MRKIPLLRAQLALTLPAACGGDDGSGLGAESSSTSAATGADAAGTSTGSDPTTTATATTEGTQSSGGSAADGTIEPESGTDSGTGDPTTGGALPTPETTLLTVVNGVTGSCPAGFELELWPHMLIEIDGEEPEFPEVGRLWVRAIEPGPHLVELRHNVFGCTSVFYSEVIDFGEHESYVLLAGGAGDLGQEWTELTNATDSFTGHPGQLMLANLLGSAAAATFTVDGDATTVPARSFETMAVAPDDVATVTVDVVAGPAAATPAFMVAEDWWAARVCFVGDEPTTVGCTWMSGPP